MLLSILKIKVLKRKTIVMSSFQRRHNDIEHFLCQILVLMLRHNKNLFVKFFFRDFSRINFR